MKKPLSMFLLLLFLFDAVSLALTENEIKYKWNELDLVTKYKSGATATWSQYGGDTYQSGKLNLQQENGQDIISWNITKGGEPISEQRFSEIIGNQGKASEISFDSSWRQTLGWIGKIAFVGGVAFTMAAPEGSNKQQNQMVSGSIAAAGYLLAILIRPPEHYLTYSEVGYQIDTYNNKLKKDLGL